MHTAKASLVARTLVVLATNEKIHRLAEEGGGAEGMAAERNYYSIQEYPHYVPALAPVLSIPRKDI